ncbi:MAG: response regulator [Terrimicrobiaceae bacterium]
MNQTPQSRCSVLYIDDEEKALKYFRMAVAPKFSVHTASSGEEGLAILRKEAGKIGIVVSDQRMPGMIGAEVLGVVREEFPQVVRILTTAYSDLDSAILAVNKGYIYQYVVKPWDVTELEMVLQRAADYYQILTERNQLLRLKMTTLQRILCCDRVKWLLLAFGTGPGTSEGAFRNALFSFVRSLEALPPPRQEGGDVFRAEQFDAAALIRRELHTGGQIKAMLVDKGGMGPIPPECEQVSRLGAGGKDLAAALGGFLSSLPGDVAKAVKTAEDVEVTLSPSAPGFAGELAGILFGGDPQPSSVLLLGLFWMFAEAGIPLTLVVRQPGSGDHRFALSPQAATPDDVLEALRSVFEHWDIASI